MNTDNEQQETSIADDIRNAINEINNHKDLDQSSDNTQQETETVEKDKRSRDEKTGRFSKEESKDEIEFKEEPLVEKKVKVSPPSSLSASVKAKWDLLDPEVQAEWIRREEEVHKGFTKLDEDRNLGKSMKDVISPYMAVIKAEGGTPEKAVSDLLNTAYQLRTSDPVRKAQIVHDIIRTYGVDMGHLQYVQGNEGRVDPMIAHLQSKIQELEQRSNPDLIARQMRENMEIQEAVSKVNAFASDPKNVHYPKVREIMKSLIESGAAKDLDEAYQAACRAHPVVFSTLEADRMVKDQAKKDAELAAKKRAAVSVTGSPGIHIANSGAPDRDLRAELLANYRAMTSA